MNYTKEDFINFCKLYEEKNEFEYDETNLSEIKHGYKYEATFRDEHNYKISFDIFLDGSVIRWEAPSFNNDENEDTEPFFYDLIEEVFSDFIREITNN